jgi:phospholipid/cholesterol/gamma-HCH transport system substrate-binding protein
LKISKELVTGIITIAAIAVLVAGVNFLKGNSFFGGDKVYYAYFPNSGQLSPASPVTLNGVIVGRVLSIDIFPNNAPEKKVKVAFNIQEDNVKIPFGSYIEIGSLDFFSKGMILHMNADLSKGYHKPNDVIDGVVATDMVTQVKAIADPIIKKVQVALGSIDEMVNSVSAFWDTTATSELKGSMKELQIAIHRLGNVAADVEMMMDEEKIKFSHIMSNIEGITANLKKSNEKVAAIIGNVKTISDDMVTADFKSVIGDAHKTLKAVNSVLETANNGEGTLGKLLGDDALFRELVETNQELQNLVNDLQLHPERYIHFSVLGAKTKGVPLTGSEEKKLRKLLDSIPDK